ncbi:hypothetical protein C1646_670101 [Rhizophagus diaphanus]|nr:hypothetical protein C1646_670101 [Rhizophagus diaphanus] [Rhizophagus sp. MUCL 43196]
MKGCGYWVLLSPLIKLQNFILLKIHKSNITYYLTRFRYSSKVLADLWTVSDVGFNEDKTLKGSRKQVRIRLLRRFLSVILKSVNFLDLDAVLEFEGFTGFPTPLKD